MFSIPKKMIYCNYEVLTQAMATNIIDFSKADIYELQNHEMTDGELEKFLSLMNDYTTPSWVHRAEQIKVLKQAVSSISTAGKKEVGLKRVIKQTAEKTYDQIVNETKKAQDKI